MGIIKHNSVFPSLFDDDMGNLFQGFLRPISHSNLGHYGNHLPVVDIDENETEFYLMAELPGFKKEDIKVTFQGGQLTINAQHDEESESKPKEGSIIKERRFGKFYRTFNFGENISENDTVAKYENGVLELTIPKIEKAESKTNKVDIN